MARISANSTGGVAAPRSLSAERAETRRHDGAKHDHPKHHHKHHSNADHHKGHSSFDPPRARVMGHAAGTKNCTTGTTGGTEAQ